MTQEAQETAAEEPAKQMVQETARDMVATVTGWVTEFQQKRRMETTQALKTLRSLCRDAAPQAG
ncbi:MAG: hypothetical protein H0U60_07345 [Blastocatellia bacterium]|nr:hypothetical protein [Blastocatellia bacterium]